MQADLDTRLLAAHAEENRAALIALYAEASEGARGLTARRFYLTHAYVYALEAGSPEAVTMRRKLVDLGAETSD